MDRLERIVGAIIFDGVATSKNAAWQYLRSVSAKTEAEMIDLSRRTQQDVIAIIGKVKPKDFADYKTQKLIDSVKKQLGVMVANCEILARRMVIANILSGKVREISYSKKTGDALVALIALNDSDHARIDKMVTEVIGRIQQGVNWTLSSINRMIQNTAIRANMVQPQPKPTKTEMPDKESKEDSIDVTQEPISSMFDGEDVKQKRPQKTYIEKNPTNEELAEIKKDPIGYANKQAKQNVDIVNKLHQEYLNGQKNNPLESQKLREKALKEINGNPVAKAVFELNKLLRSQGLFAFTDKGGKRWTLEAYCAMTTRTVAQKSTNLGEVFANEEHDLYYIVPHAGACPLCKKYEGRVYSRSGKNPNYPPLSTAFTKIDPNGSDDLDNTYMSIHPNCRHKIVKYVIQAHTKEKQKEMLVKSNKPFELTAKQRFQIAEQKERDKKFNEREAAMREFMMYLQVLPPKDVCGTFIKFFEHKQKDDNVYKEVKRKYAEALKQKKATTK